VLSILAVAGPLGIHNQGGALNLMQSCPMPLSPRMLNIQQPQQLSPRKRTSSRKENANSGGSPKRFLYNEAAVRLLAFSALHRQIFFIFNLAFKTMCYTVNQLNYKVTLR